MPLRKEVDGRIQYNKIRLGLVQGRIRRGVWASREPSVVSLPFEQALNEATIDDLRWAFGTLLNKRSKRHTYREKRQKAIADRMLVYLRELVYNKIWHM